jgi:hypothetical protein
MSPVDADLQKESVADAQTQNGADPLAVGSFAGRLPSEQVLWTGRPVPLAYACRRLSPALPFGVIVLAFTALWELNAVGDGHSPAWAVSGLPFLVAGLHAVLLRPLLLVLVARRRAYAVTDRRVVRLHRRRTGVEVVESACAWRPLLATDVPWPGGRSLADVTIGGAPVRAGRWGWWGIGEDGDVLACLADAPAALAALAQLRAGSAAPAGAWAGAVETP